MKTRKKAVVYDWEYMNHPLHTTLKKTPKGVRHITGHQLMSVLWFCAGITFSAMAVLEIFTGFLYHTIINAASNQLADFFGIDASTIAGLAAQALLQGKLILTGAELLIGGTFFFCSYYCRRMITRSRYIKMLEAAAKKETAFIIREAEREFEAAE